MSQLTYTNLQQRAADIMGESSASTTLKSHINAAIQDIMLVHPWSWALKKDTSTVVLSSGADNLPSDYNAKWGLADARIVNSSTGDDNVFTRIPITDVDNYGSDDYVYWITWTAASSVHTFNSLTQSGTVQIYYYHIPSDLSAGADVCIVPDSEAVAYLAAAKMYLGDERNQGLYQLFSQEAATRIRNLLMADAAQEVDGMPLNSIIELNSGMLGLRSDVVAKSNGVIPFVR